MKARIVINNIKGGTYSFDTFKNKDTELNRLINQATLLSELELKILQSNGLVDGINILDAACGPGIITRMISSNLKNAKVTGIDINETLLEKAKVLSEGHEPVIRFMKADIYNLPFQNEFDFVYCRFLFQHLDNPLKAIHSIYNSLKPGGRICIVDVDDDWLSLYPQLPAFKELCSLTYEAQKKKWWRQESWKKVKKLFERMF